ncbi:MAG: DUF3025 domain-containing protein [Gammaproteobacteria bacterium]|nr:DUF3025 domain-containing protein [Gammaproteobacteria bacterium]MCK5091502.1 DUF3025 domain-containing protein [Gammaproteobacteria bacterium]
MKPDIDLLVHWTPNFLTWSPMYEPLQSLSGMFSSFLDGWPGLDDYQKILDAQSEMILTHAGKKLRVVKQDDKPQGFKEHYAPRIYLKGEIQTRSENWHDFFQLLTWCLFPKSKAVINAIHIPRVKERIEKGVDTGRRSPVENMLSLFDEGGAVVVSSDESLLQLIRDFQWKELFWNHRDELAEKLQCITFGHAIYEKGLMPYVGMTANSILLVVDKSFFRQTLEERLDYIDEQLALLFSNGTQYTKPKDLSPFPVLGLPGWDPDNELEAYYDNTDYFRRGRGGNRSSYGA